MNKNEKGFGAIEAILLLLIAGLIGSVGFYIYKSQKATNRSLDNANKSLSDLAKTNSRQAAEQNAAKEQESWLLYTSKDKTYSIRIPDGWDLLTVTPQENLHGRDTSSIVYKKGVKAKVTSVEGGWDGPSRFSPKLLAFSAITAGLSCS